MYSMYFHDITNLYQTVLEHLKPGTTVVLLIISTDHTQVTLFGNTYNGLSTVFDTWKHSKRHMLTIL